MIVEMDEAVRFSFSPKQAGDLAAILSFRLNAAVDAQIGQGIVAGNIFGEEIGGAPSEVIQRVTDITTWISFGINGSDPTSRMLLAAWAVERLNGWADYLQAKRLLLSRFPQTESHKVKAFLREVAADILDTNAYQQSEAETGLLRPFLTMGKSLVVGSFDEIFDYAKQRGVVLDQKPESREVAWVIKRVQEKNIQANGRVVGLLEQGKKTYLEKVNRILEAADLSGHRQEFIAAAIRAQREASRWDRALAVFLGLRYGV